MYRGRTTTLGTFIRGLKPPCKPHKGTGCNDPSRSLCDQWHLRRDAATIQRNTCKLRYLKQHNIKNLFIKLTRTLRTEMFHFFAVDNQKNQQRVTHSLTTTRAIMWLVPLIAKYDGLPRRFFVSQCFSFGFFNFWFFV